MKDLAGLDPRSLDPSDAGRRFRYGRRLGRERKAAGLSQEEAASRAGVSQATLSRVEQGEEVSEETLRAVEGLYAIPNPYPSAPLDPVRRMAWFAEVSRTIEPGSPESGIFGKGVPPKEAA